MKMRQLPTKKCKAHTLDNSERKAYVISSIPCHSYYTIIPDDDEGTFDVIVAHQEQNCKPKTPSVDHLCQSAACQGSSTCP